jgi:nucleoid DNA-binding protein
MNNAELASAVAARTDLSDGDARTAVGALFDLLSAELEKGGEVALVGFGKFTIARRGARMGANPSTGEQINIAASKRARFLPASALKAQINGRPQRSSGRGVGQTRRARSSTAPARGEVSTGGSGDTPSPPPSSPPASPEPEPSPARRFLLGQAPQTVRVDGPFSVLVRVVTHDTGVMLKPLDVPEDGLAILLVAHAPDLRLVGEDRRTLLVPRDGDSDPVMFEFRAAQEGFHDISISAWNGGSYLGELNLHVTVEAGGRTSEARNVTGDLKVGSVDGAVSLVVRFEPEQNTYRFEFHDIDNPREVCSSVAFGPNKSLEELVASLNTLAANEASYTAKETRNYLRNAGVGLWQKIVPPELKQQFWERRDRIKELTIFTDKDPVPWELMYPLDKGHDEGFLVEQFPVTRGVFDRFPSRTLSLRPARFVLPDAAPSAAADEVEALQVLLGTKSSNAGVISSLASLTSTIKRGRFGLLHFACHNSTNGGSGEPVIMLDGRAFTPTDLEAARIETPLAKRQPLVFINACGSSKGVERYNRLDSWAAAFIDAGAAAFVGSLWNVRDGTAREFAGALYESLEGELPLGEAMMKARQVAAASPGDPTWLAYTVYGDARAAVP